MSENIKITVVTDNEKLNTKTEAQNESSIIVTHDSSMTIMSTLLKNNLISGSFCGGRGDCGRCRIQFLKGMTVPTPLERSVMEAEELRQGYRLACLARPKDDCVIKLDLVDAPQIDIVSKMIDVTERVDRMSQQKNKTENQKSHVTESTEKSEKESAKVSNDTGDIFKDKETLIAVDLGTTTIAMQLMTIDTGHVVDTYCEMNPQRRYGADVLSRIKASCEGAGENLQQMVMGVLERGVSRFEKCLSGRSGIVRGMCIAGNTTMEHLLMGYDVSSLGVSPFTPVEIGLQEYKYPAWKFPVWLTPGISAFVGGDIVAGLYALGMLPGVQDSGLHAEQENAVQENTAQRNAVQKNTAQRNAVQENTAQRNAVQENTAQRNAVQENTAQRNAVQKNIAQKSVMQENIGCASENTDVQKKDAPAATLLIDLGTNGEMAITDGSRMIVTATAAGPAFEGGAGAGVVGSDMIACTASLLRQGILDETGLLEEPYFTEGVTVGEPAVQLSNKDIRALQMAKAAVRAGIEILWRLMGEPEISRVYLAGGFGYYLDAEAAFGIGLLPTHMRGKVESVGNTSLAGAFRIGRDLLEGRMDKEKLEWGLSYIECVNLAEQDKFEELYVRYMNLVES